MDLHTETVAILDTWIAPDPAQEMLRSAYLAFLRTHHDGIWRSCVPAHVTASALIVDPAAERVLLVLHGKANMWLQTGGHCEPSDTSLSGAALRESVEESGITDLTLAADGQPVRLDRHTAHCQLGIAEHHLDVQYLVLAPPDAVATANEESHDLEWFGYEALPSPLGSGIEELVTSARARLAATCLTRP